MENSPLPSTHWELLVKPRCLNLSARSSLSTTLARQRRSPTQLVNRVRTHPGYVRFDHAPQSVIGKAPATVLRADADATNAPMFISSIILPGSLRSQESKPSHFLYPSP